MKSLLLDIDSKNPDFIALTLNLCVNISKANSRSKRSVFKLTTSIKVHCVGDVSSYRGVTKITLYLDDIPF